jgi:putative hydroxymethylpyrimidine transport system permease protein
MMSRLLFLFSLGITWWVITTFTNIPHFLVPPPDQVMQSFINQGTTLAEHTVLSLGEILAGLSIGLFVALLLTFIFAQMPTWTAPTLSMLTGLQAIPVFALLPLLILWLGHGLSTKIAVVSLSCFFPITIAALNGLSRISPGYHDLTFLFKASALQKFRHVELPALMPYLLTGFRLAAVHAPVTVIAADWIGATHGLGYLIMLASGRLQVDLLFAAIICLICLSLCLNKLCHFLHHKLIYWPSES